MLKKIILVLLLVSSAFSSEIKWEKDFKTAIKKAQELNKPVFFVSSRHTCRYCVILEDTTFQDAQVIAALNENFISVVSYSDENDYVPRKLRRPGTPAMWFLLPSGRPMYQPLMGAYKAKDMIPALKQVEQDFKSLELKGKK